MLKMLWLSAATWTIFISCVPATASAPALPPGKLVTIVVGFAAGGGADAAARLIARKVSEEIGQNVVVENRPGAGGNIAHQYVANAAPDGSILLYGSVGPLTIAPHLMKLNYDPFTDLAAISGGVQYPNVLVVPASANIKTLAELVQRAKEEPDTLTFASTGVGSASHLTGEMLNQRAQIEMLHVPYKGGAPAMQDLVGGRVTAYFSSPPTAQPQVASGKLIALATTGATRSSFFPTVPTLIESGYPEFEVLNWFPFLAPGATPEAVLESWNQALVKVLNDRDTRAALEQHGFIPQPSTRTELTEFMHKEFDRWAAMIKERGIGAE